MRDNCRSGSNYIIDGASSNGQSQYKYLLNVCAPLLANQVTTNKGDIKSCPQTWEVCQVDLTYDLDPKELGSYPGDVVPTVLSRGHLLLNYTNGEMCVRKGVERHTAILLTCDQTAGVGKPVFIKEDEACGYTFEWKTAAACPVKVAVSPSTKPPAPPTNCEVVDNANKMRYDLTALSKATGNLRWSRELTDKQLINKYI